jgi:hypothetical protein
MIYAKAVKIAIEVMQKEKKAHAFDANLYLRFNVRNPTAESAYRRTQELDQAISVLRGQPALDLFK